MKKKVFREKYKKGFTFTVADVDGYQEGAIEKVAKEVIKTLNKESKKKTKKGAK